jgi:hypothetical protein
VTRFGQYRTEVTGVLPSARILLEGALEMNRRGLISCQGTAFLTCSIQLRACLCVPVANTHLPNGACRLIIVANFRETNRNARAKPISTFHSL